MNGRTAGAVLAVLVAAAACGAPTPAIPSSPPGGTEVPVQVIVRDDLQEVFAAAGVTGTFALLDTASGRHSGFRSAASCSPASASLVCRHANSRQTLGGKS